MRASTSIASAAVLSLAAAGNAPAITNNPLGVSYQALLVDSASSNITGAVKAAAAPNGQGTNLLVAFYNLPGGNISYGIYTGRVGANADCSLAGAILNPYQGVSGSACTSNNEQACEIGDLSDKHGSAYTQSGGAGTGYFAANYIDDYLSLDSSSEAFIGKGSLVVMSSNGTPLTCADFVNANKAPASIKTSTKGSSSTTATGQASSSPSGSSTTTGSGTQASSTAKTTSSGSGAMPTAMMAGSGLLAAGGLAALFL